MKQLYVYTHSVGGTVIYVGRGNQHRPHNFHSRSTEHKRAVAAAGGRQSVVVAVQKCASELRAAQLEYAWIRRYSGPGLTNKIHNSSAQTNAAIDRARVKPSA